VALAYIVLRFLFDTIDGVLQPGIHELLLLLDFDREIPGAGIAVMVILIYLLGLLGANVLGKQVVRLGQSVLQHIPFVSTIYSPAKKLIESFSGEGADGFKRVVLIEYPRPKIWTIGFLTAMTTDEEGKGLALIYIPTAPTPQSGWVALVPVEDVYDCDLTLQQALNSVLSGGILSPPQIKKKALVL